MTYKQLNIEGYKELNKEKIRQLRRPKANIPYVIFIDGKNATKEHRYDMFSEKSFTYYLAKASEKVCIKHSIAYKIYAVMDEATIILPEGITPGVLGGDTLYEIVTVFSQEVCKEFWKNVDCYLKAVIYETTDENISKIINFRKKVGEATALEYYAKEHLKKEEYHNKSKEQIIKNLKNNNIYNEYNNNIQFKTGIYLDSNIHIETDDVIDEYAEILKKG